MTEVKPTNYKTITILAVATKDAPEIKNFCNSAAKAGYNDVRVIGRGAKWKNTSSKLQLFCKELKSMASDTLVACTDCYDVLFQGSPASLIGQFQAQKSPIVLSTETGISKRIHYGPMRSIYYLQRPDVPKTKYCSENGGFVMGRAGDLIVMFEWALAHVDENATGFTADQYGLGMYATHFPDRVHLDTMQQFCAVFIGDQYHTDWKWDGAMLRNVITGASPPVCHFPAIKRQAKRLCYNQVAGALVPQLHRPAKKQSQPQPKQAQSKVKALKHRTLKTQKQRLVRMVIRRRK